LSLARTLISLWLNLVRDNNNLDTESGVSLFSDAAVCSSSCQAHAGGAAGTEQQQPCSNQPQ
jgi:hypothetical protein